MMATKKTLRSDTDAEAVSYGELSTELDEVLSRLENPELDIDEATTLYERGLTLVSRMETHLQQAENTIEKVRENFARE